MKAILDLYTLRQELRQAEEREPQFDVELNPYLLHTVIPRLEREEAIKLSEIDLSAFDADDPGIIIDYFKWREDLQYSLSRLTGRLCEKKPMPAKVRSFL